MKSSVAKPLKPVKPVYAVRSGRVCGVFMDVDSLHKSVMDFHGAEFAQFDNLTQADMYLARYCELYDCQPSIAKGIVVLQTIAQPVVIDGSEKTKHTLCAAACFKDPYTTASNKSTHEQTQVQAVLELLRQMPDEDPEKDDPETPVPDYGILVGGMNLSEDGSKATPFNYVIEALRKFEQLDEDNKVESPVAYRDKPCMLQYGAEKTFDALCEIVEVNNRRRKRAVLASSDNINSLYAVRVATINAGNVLGQLYNSVKNDAKKDL